MWQNTIIQSMIRIHVTEYSYSAIHLNCSVRKSNVGKLLTSGQNKITRRSAMIQFSRYPGYWTLRCTRWICSKIRRGITEISGDWPGVWGQYTSINTNSPKDSFSHGRGLPLLVQDGPIQKESKGQHRSSGWIQRYNFPAIFEQKYENRTGSVGISIISINLDHRITWQIRTRSIRRGSCGFP